MKKILSVFGTAGILSTALVPMINVDQSLSTSSSTLNIKNLDSLIEKPTLENNFAVSAFARKNLQSDIKNYNLGTFNSKTTITANQFLARLKQLNPNVRTQELRVETISAFGISINVKAGSTVYNKLPYPIHLSYKNIGDTRKQVVEDFRVYDLGVFRSRPTVSQVLVRLKQLNPKLKVEELVISMPPFWDDYLMVEVKAGSTVYHQRGVGLSYTVA